MKVRSVQEAEAERQEEKEREAADYQFLQRPCLANLIAGERTESKSGKGGPREIIPLRGEHIMKIGVIIAIAACAAGITACTGTTTLKDASNTTSYSQDGVTVSTSGSAGEIDHSTP
jgi:hypothetical protein